MFPASSTGRRAADGDKDLPSDGNEVDTMAITESDRIHWSSRREICSEYEQIETHGAIARVHLQKLQFCAPVRAIADSLPCNRRDPGSYSGGMTA